jgi:hypothetical protein
LVRLKPDTIYENAFEIYENAFEYECGPPLALTTGDEIVDSCFVEEQKNMRSFIGNVVLAAALGVASVISVQAAPQAASTGNHPTSTQGSHSA